MQVALTGATGYVGFHVLTELHAHGHEATALVRCHTRELLPLRIAAPKPAVVDLYDRAAVVNVLSHNLYGAVHTASPGDATSVDLDSAVVDAVIEGFEGTGKAYVQISWSVDLWEQYVHSGGLPLQCARTKRDGKSPYRAECWPLEIFACCRARFRHRLR